MVKHRRVTEEDLLETEALIAQSYLRLKRSVVTTPARMVQSAGKTAAEHPYATAAAVVIAGAALYGIYRVMTSRATDRGAAGRQPSAMHDVMNHQNLMFDLLMMAIPMMIPYIPQYLRKYMGSILFKKTS
jgi:hypothetical protein